ncbi:primosomal protein N' [Nocardia tengchongensis]|uniref:Probable replication restart protein PriA n=1 Tax=Nocardia tengchongensis TaxID=2055889 RepID=A0ABX8CZP7_9NOCA|nr:primosomal protein N' [Nocardia tengchongensis]QVI25182.1 primosomal protein N' [Nocardia tengchongensis]
MARVLPLLEPAHLDRDFDYVVPPELDELAQPGVRVRVRFSGRLIDGYLLERLERSDHTGKLVRLERVVSGERVLTPEILKLVTAVAARYAGTRADVLRLAIPPRHAKVETEGTEKPEKPKRTSKKNATADSVVAVDGVVDLDAEQFSVAEQPGNAPAASAVAAPGSADIAAAQADLDGVEPATESGLGLTESGSATEGATFDHNAVPVPVEPADAVAVGNTTEIGSTAGPARDGGEFIGGAAADGAGVEPVTPPEGEPGPQELSAAPSQSLAAEFPGWGRYVHGHSFLGALAAGRGPRAGWQALPGEDWARRLAELAAVTVRGGRGAVIMVPDQRDLDRVLAECVALLGESAVGLAAGLGPSARYRRWLSVLRGQAKVVVGTRSAVFSPVRDLGLIAMWDDGDDTFAEPRSPYPHAREVAMLRAHETGAAFVAAGFARTAEVQAIVESGWAHDLLADRSVLRQAMPRIAAPGDTDAALERDPIAQAIRIPAVAFMEARKALKDGGAVLVQVPRRGYIPALSCAKCRIPARCRHCNGPLALPDSAPASRGALRSGREGVAEAQSPACRWCGITEAAFRCGACGSRALRAVVIGASRTAEELGRAFPGVPVRGSGGSTILNTVPAGAQVVVSTIGAEPPVPGGYAVAMLLDGWALLGRADLRAAEDALRRWMSAAALVRPGGRVIVMADAALPTVQALVRWDPVWHARFELEQRTEVRFPPAVRFAAIDGTSDSIAELLGEAKLPGNVEVLGPVPLPPGARKPFSSGDSPAEVERMILRADRSGAAALSRALTAAQAVRSTHRSDAPLRVQIDPIDIG